MTATPEKIEIELPLETGGGRLTFDSRAEADAYRRDVLDPFMADLQPAREFDPDEYDEDGCMLIHDTGELLQDEHRPHESCFVERPGEWRVLFGSWDTACAWVEAFAQSDAETVLPETLPRFSRVVSLR